MAWNNSAICLVNIFDTLRHDREKNLCGKNVWIFKYEFGTKFIGAYHLNGGKQSICELVNHIEPDAFGIAIVEFLNKKAEK